MARGIKSIFLISLVLLTLPFATAYDTQINVKTWPGYQVSIFVVAPGEKYSLYNSYHQTAGNDGKVSVVYTGDKAEFKVNVKVEKDGVTLLFEKFPETEAGKTKYYQVIPGEVMEDYSGTEPEANQTETNETTASSTQSNETEVNDTVQETQTQTETTTTPSTNGITGKVTSFELGSNFSNFKLSSSYYIIIGIVLGGIVLFVFRRKIKTSFSSSPVDPVIRSTYDPSTNPNFEKSLRSAENRIAEAQSEINKLKNQDKISAAETKLRKDMADLERMKRGEI